MTQFMDWKPYAQSVHVHSGWLGKTTGDVGLLNDAYIASNAARKLAKGG